jgi:hypothetical protein
LEPPEAQKAELEFRKAWDRGCARPELVELWIEAKEILEDWRGLEDLTRVFERRNGPDPSLLHARAVSRIEQAREMFSRGEKPSAAEVLLETGQEIDKAFAEGRVHGIAPELKRLRNIVFLQYVRLIDQIFVNQDQFLEIWIACYEAFRCFVRLNDIIMLGLHRLEQWWDAVEQRHKFDAKALGHLERCIDELSTVVSAISMQKEPDWMLLEESKRVLSELQERSEIYLYKNRSG